MTKVETQQDQRRAAFARKPTRKPIAFDRLDLWMSTGREIDGLWVGTIEGKPHPGLHRVEDALRLIKHHNSLHYSRVVRNLERVWVRILTIADACYSGPLGACMFDKRFVLQETTTVEEIASTIIHEATHARLARWGISYDEKARARIEAVCLRRELNFIANLPNAKPLREQKSRTLEWCVSNHDYFSDLSFQQRGHQGAVEALRYLGTPEWLIGFVLKVEATVVLARQLVRRFAGRPPQT